MPTNKLVFLIFLILVFTVSSVYAFASRPPLDAVASSKAGWVTQSELDTALNRYIRQISRVSGGKPLSETELADLRQSTLNDLVYRKIFSAIAEKKKLLVYDSEVKERYDIVCTGLFDGNEEAFKKGLVEDGWTEVSYMHNLKEIVLSEKARALMMDNIEPEPSAVKAYYDSHKNEFTVSEIEIAHILISAPDTDLPERGLKSVRTVMIERGVAADSLDERVELEIKSRIDRLKSVRDSALAGTEFGELASRHSDDGSSVQGGYLGFVPKGRTVKSFEEAAFALKKGEVSDIVKTEFGLHIIKAISDTRERLQEFAEVEFTIAAKLRAENEANRLQDLEKKWKVVRN